MPREDVFFFCKNKMTDSIAQASKLQAFGPQAGLMVTLCNYSRVPIQVTVEQVCDDNELAVVHLQ